MAKGRINRAAITTMVRAAHFRAGSTGIFPDRASHMPAMENALIPRIIHAGR